MRIPRMTRWLARVTGVAVAGVLIAGSAILPAEAGSAPSISSFYPTSGPVGTGVTIHGSNFTGTSSVRFNGTSAGFSLNGGGTQMHDLGPERGHDRSNHRDDLQRNGPDLHQLHRHEQLRAAVDLIVLAPERSGRHSRYHHGLPLLGRHLGDVQRQERHLHRERAGTRYLDHRSLRCDHGQDRQRPDRLGSELR